MHHRDAVNENLRAGQKVRITDNAKNKDIHWEIGEFVKYTDVLVEIGGKTYGVVTNSLDEVVKDSQNLRHGDDVRVNAGAKKKEIHGRTGKFVEYTRVAVNIDGAEHGVHPNSVERV